MVNHAVNLAKTALAKINNVEAGTTTTVDARVSPLSQSLGVTYDSNNNVTSNQTNDDIADLQTRLTALENRLSNYENHTHSYTDDTINDTADGSGTITTTTKSTGAVE